MFKSKLLVPLIFGLVIFVTAFLTIGCETADPAPEVDEIEPEEEVDAVDEAAEEKVDEEEKEKVDAAEEGINGDLALMLPTTAWNLAASPDGEYLLFTMAAAPIEPYHIINTETYEGEICDDRGIYWGEIENLPTPGFETAQVYNPHFSPDGEKLLYVSYEVKDYKHVNAAIYLCKVGLPPEIEDQVDLSGEEFIREIRPAWKADQQGIYYLTAKGVMSYCPEEQQAEKLHSAQDLNGLVQDDSLAAHAFHVKDDIARLAYY